MIIRIVKMTFHPDKTDEFIRIFTGAQHKIETFVGCKGVDLTRDLQQPNIFITISLWENVHALNIYRNSELFQSTWAKTKVLFSERPDAWSLDKLM